MKHSWKLRGTSFPKVRRRLDPSVLVMVIFFPPPPAIDQHDVFLQYVLIKVELLQALLSPLPLGGVVWNVCCCPTPLPPTLPHNQALLSCFKRTLNPCDPYLKSQIIAETALQSPGLKLSVAHVSSQFMKIKQ